MAKKKKHMVCKCGEDKEVIFAGTGVHYPTFSCHNCGPDKRNEWEIWWLAYKDTWRDDEKWNRPADALVCVVGFFCYYYEQFYDEPFVFSYQSAKPYTDKDFMMARRILTMFNGEAKEVKTYIRWVFAKKIKTPKYEVQGLGFFGLQKFANEYRRAKARTRRLTRFSKLPKAFLYWCKENAADVFNSQELETWNDLNGIVSIIKNYGREGAEWVVAQEAVRRGMLPPGPEFRKLEE